MNVYISHSGRDRRLAEEISRVLYRAGMAVWDASHILPGENWADATADALRTSTAMVVLVTPQSAGSPTSKLDVGYALGQPAFKDRVIPILVGPTDLLGAVSWVLKRFPRIELDPGTDDFGPLGELPSLLGAR